MAAIALCTSHEVFIADAAVAADADDDIAVVPSAALSRSLSPVVTPRRDNEMESHSSSSSVSSTSISSGPQLVLRIGVREAAVALSVGAAFVGVWHVREWNKRRLLAREERRKARAKEWAKMKQKAYDAAFYTAVLAGVGVVSYAYFSLQKAWQDSSDSAPAFARNEVRPQL